MDITVLKSSANYILGVGVHTPSGTLFNLLCIYGDASHQDTSRIWHDVGAFVTQSRHRASICMGDLNDIMSPDEKLGCNPPNLNRIAIFYHHMRNLGLIDMGYNGPAYTWTNKRKGKEVIFERLDRCLANVDWCHIFPNTTVYHLPLIYGDHAPILVLLNPNFRKPKNSFKFENWWLLE